MIFTNSMFVNCFAITAANTAISAKSVAAVNCDDTNLGNDNLAQQIGIQGFPTLYFVTGNGQLEQYDGGRDLQPLLESIVDMSKNQ